MSRTQLSNYLAALFLLALFGATRVYARNQAPATRMAVYNVKDYGATGTKAADLEAQPSKKAIDAARRSRWRDGLSSPRGIHLRNAAPA